MTQVEGDSYDIHQKHLFISIFFCQQKPIILLMAGNQLLMISVIFHFVPSTNSGQDLRRISC
jgi:hypothetical protein